MDYPATGKEVAGEVERYGCHRDRRYLAGACQLWAGRDVKEQSCILQEVNEGIAFFPNSQTIYRAPMKTTKLIKPGENHRKMVILWLPTQAQVYKLLQSWPVVKEVQVVHCVVPLEGSSARKPEAGRSWIALGQLVAKPNSKWLGGTEAFLFIYWQTVVVGFKGYDNSFHAVLRRRCKQHAMAWLVSGYWLSVVKLTLQSHAGFWEARKSDASLIRIHTNLFLSGTL